MLRGDKLDHINALRKPQREENREMKRNKEQINI